MKGRTLNENRIFWLDAARAAAIILICLNHAVNRAYATSTGQAAEFSAIPLASTIFKTLMYVLTKLGVPLFLMISGALLLKKNITNSDGVKKFYKNNLLKLFITAEIWYVIVFFFKAYSVISSGEMTVSYTAYSLISTLLFVNQVTYTSMWYMPMIMCIYLLIPFLCIIRDRINLKTALVPLAVLLYTSFIIPTVDSFANVFGKERPHIAGAVVTLSPYFIFVIAGYLISRGYLKKLKNIFVILGFLLPFLLTCAFQMYIYSTKTDLALPYNDFGVLVSSVFLFELIRRFSEKLKKLERQVDYLSKISFGIYCVHMIIMTVLAKNTVGLKAQMPQYCYFFFIAAVSVVGSIIIIAPTSKIPFIRKYFYLMK